MNQILSSRRLASLAKKDFYQYWRPTLAVSGILVGAVIILGFIRSTMVDIIPYREYFQRFLVIWCIVAASSAFRELHDKSRNDDFLLLPASALEKTLVRLIGVSAGIPLIFIVVMFIASLCTELLRLAILKTPMAVFNPVNAEAWLVILRVIAIQSVFFLGAAWFKRRHLLKTALVLLVFFIALGIIGGTIFRIAYSSVYFSPEASAIKPDLYMTFKQLEGPWLGILLRIIFYGVIPLLCWTTAWMRVKECQSSHGI
ncbi:MAG: hypothetical protein B0D92_06765 [Spirochaeta sp. LUC14_002_19_P3]|nr:MAG: hypothetical protein B0D92_06765 [Spirochaeta sp. LUC14_002_19_P3]